MDKFWTKQRRSWLYSVATSLIPLFVAVGLLTNDIAQLVLNVLAAILAVGSGSMALAHMTPDHVVEIGFETVGDDMPEEDE